MAKEKSKKMTKKEEEKLNEKVDKIIEKNFADFSSQDELENFLQDAFDTKTSKFNKNLKKKEKEINKKVSKVYIYSTFLKFLSAVLRYMILITTNTKAIADTDCCAYTLIPKIEFPLS